MAQDSDNRPDQRIQTYIEAAQRMGQRDFDVEISTGPLDDIGQLGASLEELAQRLNDWYEQLHKLDEITLRANSGLLLSEILEHIYNEFQAVIPYDRIGVSFIVNNGRTVRAQWAKSDYDGELKLDAGYEASLAGSSLQTIVHTGQPRIINDLVAYLAQKPESESTRLVVEEGVRSSLTCPLVANGVPVGFIFFSSNQSYTYADAHVEIFKQIAGQVSVIVEKGKLVTELANQKAEIERQYQELRRLTDLKNRFLGMAAHDLRSPIVAIDMGLQVLMQSGDGLSPAERELTLHDLSDQARYMLALLDDLLTVTEIESGKLVVIPRAVVVHDFLDEIVTRHTRIATQKGTHVTLDVADSGVVMADPRRLRQAIDNLISNAVKYSPPDSEVYVSGRRVEEGWEFSVQDWGPGIMPEDRERLFQAFGRLSAQPTGGEVSVGLGLAITRRIVEAHGGTIGVESDVGEGSLFWFCLPDERED